MIISREYVTFRHLVNSGDEGGKVFIEKLHESYDKSMWDEVWSILAEKCLYQREMSWAFSKLGEVIDAFALLDVETPFDNGCTYEDVTDAEVVYRDEESIKLHLVSNRFGDHVIIKVVRISEEKND